ncbi:MAG: Clp protease N-terminal domain-containing protein, partial [Candidatus Aenigmatarchaeota archaeon]
MAGFFDFVIKSKKEEPDKEVEAGQGIQPSQGIGAHNVVYSGIGKTPVQNLNSAGTTPNQFQNQANTPVYKQDNQVKSNDQLYQNFNQKNKISDSGRLPKDTSVAKKHEEIDLMTHLTQRSNRVFLAAQSKAKQLKNEYVDSEHLLHGLISDSEIYNLLTELKIQPQIIEE